MTEKRSYPAYFNGGAIFSPRLVDLEDGTPAAVWDCVFTVSGGDPLPEYGQPPLKRHMTNHGTHAVKGPGGAPVTIATLSPEEVKQYQQSLVERFGLQCADS